MTILILTAIGPDRPGLVEALSTVVVDHDGNWIESRLARLAGQFTGIVCVELPDAKVASFGAALERLADQGLLVSTHAALGDAETEDESGPGHAALEIVGTDRQGIVRTVSEVLARHGVNVLEWATERRGAPWSGDALFYVDAHLKLPNTLTIDALRSHLEAIAGDLMVDLEVWQ